MVEREFTVECCVRGHHVYQKEWEAEIGSKLTAQYETRPGALVQDKYAIVLEQKDVIVGHIPKFLSKITYFYLKHGGDLLVEIIGKRQIFLKAEYNSQLSMFSRLQTWKCIYSYPVLPERP